MGPETYDTFILRELFGELVWLILGLFILSLGKEFLQSIASGILWRFKSGYENNELVNVDGEWARINHIGFLRTDFTVYRWEGEKIIGGDSMTVPNSELRNMKIKQPLPMVDIPKTLRDAVK